MEICLQANNDSFVKLTVQSKNFVLHRARKNDGYLFNTVLCTVRLCDKTSEDAGQGQPMMW